MNQNLKRFGIFSWFGYRLHITQRAELIKKAGFTITSLWWGDEEKENTGSLHDLPAIVRDAGLIIDYVHAPFDNSNLLWSADNDVREKRLKVHLKWLEDCARHKIGKMVIHLTDGLEAPRPNSHGLETIKKIVAAAETMNVVVVIENIRHREHLDFVFTEIDSVNLALCYDSSHDFLWNDKPTEILSKWGSRLTTTHLCDNDGKEDRQWAIGQGVLDWKKISRALTQQKYTGPLVLEPLPKDRTQDPESFLKKSYDDLAAFADDL